MTYARVAYGLAVQAKNLEGLTYGCFPMKSSARLFLSFLLLFVAPLILTLHWQLTKHKLLASCLAPLRVPTNVT